MIEGKTVLAVIPARGGSKRLPRKNLAVLCGKPLIAWSIESAKRSKYIDRLVLSSDDDEILQVAQSLGCETVRRPPGLATDEAKTEDAILHALDTVGGYEYVACLQPTTPQRKAEDIDATIKLCDECSLPAAFYASAAGPPDGTVYVARTHWLYRERTFRMPGAGVVVTERDYVDINTTEDLADAAWMMGAEASERGAYAEGARFYEEALRIEGLI